VRAGGWWCMCVLCVCAREGGCVRVCASLGSFLPVFAQPTKCTSSEIYQPQNTKHRVLGVRSVNAAYYKRLDLLQLIFTNVGIVADEWSASAMITLPPVQSSTPTRN